MTTAIQKRQNESLATFGDRADIREMFDRIKKMIPGADKAPNDVVMMAAQKAIAHGLDITEGEIYIMQIQGRWEAHVGIKGQRRNAGNDFHFEESDDFPRRLSDDEVKADLGADYREGMVGVEVRIYNLPKAREMKDLGIPYQGRKERGYWGFATDYTKAGKPSVANTRTPAWVAQKRAEKMALRAEFPLKWERPASEQDALERLERIDDNHQRDTALPVEPTVQREDDGNVLFAPEPEPEYEEAEYREADDDLDTLFDDDPPVEPWEAAYMALDGDCLATVDKMRQAHATSDGPHEQHGWLSGVIDTICGQAVAHRDVLGAFVGRAVTAENPEGKALGKALLKVLPKQIAVKDEDGNSVKGEDGKVVYTDNPHYRQDVVDCVKRVWRLTQEARGQLSLLEDGAAKQAA